MLTRERRAHRIPSGEQRAKNFCQLFEDPFLHDVEINCFMLWVANYMLGGLGEIPLEALKKGHRVSCLHIFPLYYPLTARDLSTRLI